MKNPYQEMSDKYKAIDLQTRVEAATPHELIELLLQGARTHIANAIGNVQRNNVKGKGEQISKAVEIIEGLKVSLNHEKGGAVAANLRQFYDQIQSLLLTANLKSDEQLLLKSNELLAEILTAWKAIKPSQ